MHKLKIIIYSLPLLMALAACSGNDNGTDNGGSNTVKNENGNKIAASAPADILRLEFPRVKGGTSQVIVHRTAQYGMTYALEWDHQKRAQRWTCFRIYKDNAVKNWSRYQWEGTSWGGDPFQPDPLVPLGEQPNVRGEFSGSYYPNSNSYYQRGHICASEDRVYSQEANEQTFYMTNMMPQVGNFNGGIWMKMEDRVRSLAKSVDTLYVCKGGTIDNGSQIVGRTKSGFIVPRYFFMALLGKNKQGYKALAFWAEHLNVDKSSDNLSNYIINISTLQQLTGIDFFCNLPDDVENHVESLSAESVKRAWGFQ